MDGSDVREQDAMTPLEDAAASAVATTEREQSANGSSDGDLMDGASLMEAFLSDPTNGYQTLKYGDVMDGVIMHIDRDELLVDIGSKSEGIIPAREYSDLTPEEKQALRVGDTLLVFVVQPENPEGHPVVSLNRARQEKSWRRLQEIHEANDVIEAEVTNYNKGGLLVNLDGVRGFVPASQVSEIRGGDEASKQADMARLIGTSLPLKVIEINRHRNRLILSERQAVQERRDEMKEKLIAELTEGEVRGGRVSSICDFGAFVDIGGADGLVHLSELSWSRVRHPSEILTIGQEVDVYVLGINSQEKKIALSIKRTQPEPWSRVATAYEVGQLVRGTVTQLANFGAFARIEDGVEGLIHVSELTDERISHPKQVVQEGQELLLRIIRIDPQRRRMGLSLRRALDTPDEELIEVFGEGVLGERDQQVQRIHAALEAEGIEIGSGASERRDEDDEQRASAPAETAIEPEAVEAAPNPNLAKFQMPTERQQPKPKTKAAPRQQAQPEVRVEANAGEMSAMELAFAMAGAQSDEDSNDVVTEGASAVVEATDEQAMAAPGAVTEDEDATNDSGESETVEVKATTKAAATPKAASDAEQADDGPAKAGVDEGDESDK
ncbi:MAG TPA: 30S ribosomal protein S1 [Thermomicrobiales bacterium]|nr:30S ribosomal protein S1 [Thermomicrobiales bacterium]